MRHVTICQRRYKRIIRFILLAFLFSQWTPSVGAQEIIANPSVPEKKLSQTALRAIFSMRLRTWSDGALIRVFVFSDDSPLHIQFSKKVLNIFPYQLRRTWDRLVFSGTGQAPIEVRSIQEMYDRIAATAGAIGYVEEGILEGYASKVQVMQVE
jgi:ABC-type phosphate transport system substrate-binding protein